MRKAKIMLLLFIYTISYNAATANVSWAQGFYNTSLFRTKNDHISNIFYAGTNKKDSTDDKRLLRKARLINNLGLSALIGFFIPFINFLSLPAAIVAIWMGYHTKKRTKDLATKRAATRGIIAGWITLGFLAILTYFIIRLF